jgi:hypothetical protein
MTYQPGSKEAQFATQAINAFLSDKTRRGSLCYRARVTYLEQLEGAQGTLWLAHLRFPWLAWLRFWSSTGIGAHVWIIDAQGKAQVAYARRYSALELYPPRQTERKEVRA